MTTGRTGTSGLRAITAVIALYAFVLQAFLGAATPTTDQPRGRRASRRNT